MPISVKYNCIYIHIPKTGGTSIEYSLGMHGDVDYVGVKAYNNIIKNQDTLFGGNLQHLTALQIKNKIKNYEDYYKFTIVRNPWSRVVSAIIFNGSLENNLSCNLNKSQFKKQIQSIDYSTDHFKCQLDYIEHEGNLLVDYIGRFENIYEEYTYINSILGTNLTLEHRMKSKHKHYTEYYDDETRQIVAEKYAKDIEYFGYKFGE